MNGACFDETAVAAALDAIGATEWARANISFEDYSDGGIDGPSMSLVWMSLPDDHDVTCTIGDPDECGECAEWENGRDYAPMILDVFTPYD